jgi:glycosyltransferase involved in cell wall biosynthesis
MVTLSVVTSVYNEEPIIEKFLTALLKVRLGPAKGDIEFIIVDNGSTDGTHAILQRLQKTYGFTLLTNYGPGDITRGISTGLYRAKGEFVAILRSDYQEEPKDIPRIFDDMNRQGLDYIVGQRRNRKDPYWRFYLSFFYGLLVRLFFNFGIPDINGAPRIIRRRFLDGYRYVSKGMLIDTETLWLVKTRGGKIGYTHATHYPRTTGKSLVNPAFVFRTVWEFAQFVGYTVMAVPSVRKF